MPTFFIHASYCIGEGCKWEPRSELFAELSSELFEITTTQKAVGAVAYTLLITRLNFQLLSIH
jgi:hypothetical protein